MSFGSSALLSTYVSGFGHGRSVRSQSSAGMIFGTRGIGHGDGSGPSVYGAVRDSWRNFRLMKMLSATDWSSSDSSVQGQCAPQLPKRLDSSVGRDKASVRLVSSSHRSPSVRNSKLQAAENGRPSTAQRNGQLKRLQDFRRTRVRLKTSERALFAAEPSSRVSSYGSKSPDTPVKHISNSKARLSPRRHNNYSSSIYSPKSQAEASIEVKRAQGLVPDAISVHSPHKPHQNTSYSESNYSSHPIIPQELQNPRQVRLPLIGHASRKNSVISDDFDSRWESASSDAASMDPYMYSRDIHFSRQEFDVESNSHRRASSQPPIRGGGGGNVAKEQTRHLKPTRSGSRLGVEHLAERIRKLSYDGAEREGNASDDGDRDRDVDDVDLDVEDGRGRKRVVRVRGPLGRSVLGGHSVGARKGNPGNASFRGDIRGMREHSEDESQESAFVWWRWNLFD